MIDLTRHKMKLAAASAAALLLAATPNYAADLGGDCCADLEERVAELEATTARKGNRKVSLTVSGQVHQGVLFFDDGRETNAYVSDNDNSESRFRFTGSAKITGDWAAGYNLEIELGQGSSNLVNQLNDEGGGLNIRLSAWWIESKSLGRLTVGQFSSANDDIILADAAGAGPAAFADPLIGNSLFFRLNNGQLSDLTTNVVSAGSFDTARRNVVRYDSPIFQGAKIVAAVGEDDFWDVALWYANKLGDFKIVGGVGYAEDRDGFQRNEEFQEIKGSISVLHEPSGLFGSFAYVNREYGLGVATNSTGGGGTVATNLERGDLDYYYFNAGVVVKALPIGKTVFYGEYGEAEGGARNLDATNVAGTVDTGVLSDATLETFGFGVVQHIPAAEMEIYALYKNLDLDARNAAGARIGTEDIDIVYTGARIKF